MTVPFSMQLKGYWLGFFAWLILTFSPVAASFAQTGEGYLRLCTVSGVQWVQLAPSASEKASKPCACLNSIVTPTNEVTPSLFSKPIAVTFVQELIPSQLTFRRYNPRAPPSLS